MCCFTWLISEQDSIIAGCSGSPVAPGLCHFNRKERKIRELTQNNCLKFQVAAPCIPGVKIYAALLMICPIFIARLLTPRPR